MPQLIDEGADVYFAREALSKSGAVALLRSPAHYLALADMPKRETPAMAFGTLCHAMTLEPETVDDLYIAAPKFDRRTKVGKAGAEQFQEQYAGKEMIDIDIFQKAQRVAEAVRNHPTAGALLQDGKAEQTALWDQHGVECKARIDYTTGNSIVDLKTTHDASPDEFIKTCARFKYHMQAAHYLDGLEAITGWEPDSFTFIAVETEAPFSVGVYELDRRSIDGGRELMKRAAELYKVALSHDPQAWKSYPVEKAVLSLPGWALPSMDIL
jgi:exodeoxyribonuclease VIII